MGEWPQARVSTRRVPPTRSAVCFCAQTWNTPSSHQAVFFSLMGKRAKAICAVRSLLVLVDCILCFWSIDIGIINNNVTGDDPLTKTAGLTIEGFDGIVYGSAAYVCWLLSDHKIDHTIPQINNGLFGSIKTGYLDDPLFVCVLDGLCSALSAICIRAKNAREVAHAPKYRCRLLHRYCRAVIVIFESYQRHSPMSSLNSTLTALFTL